MSLIVKRRCRTGEIEDGVGMFDPRDVERRNVILDERERRLFEQRIEGSRTAGAEIVDGYDPIPFPQQSRAQMSTQKSCTSSDDRHRCRRDVWMVLHIVLTCRNHTSLLRELRMNVEHTGLIAAADPASAVGHRREG